MSYQHGRKLKKFWMVAGDGPSRVRHTLRRDAEHEANRLARACPGVPFYVMEAIVVHCKVDVERIDLVASEEDWDGLPF